MAEQRQAVRQRINGEEVGELLFTAYAPDADHDEVRVTVDHADPVILASVQFLDEIRAGGPWTHPCHIDGDLLKIRGENRTVIYRIMEQAPMHHAYVLRWPD